MKQVALLDRIADEDLKAVNRRGFLKHVSGTVLAVFIAGAAAGCSSDDDDDDNDDDDDDD